MIRIVVALAPEAKPVLAFLRSGRRLTSLGGPFRVYRGDDVAVVVSGMGKTAAAAATAYLHATTQELGLGSWLNVGVAGHREADVGSAFLAHKILDRGTGKTWYPPRLLDAAIPSGQVMTVDRVERSLDGSWIYDMEASGFYDAATRCATTELVHCLKIISDNRERPAELMNVRQITSLVEARLEDLSAVLDALSDLAEVARRTAADPPELRAFLRRWHFTTSEARRLRRVLQRWQTLMRGPALGSGAEALPRAADVLHYLEERLDALPLSFEPSTDRR